MEEQQAAIVTLVKDVDHHTLNEADKTYSSNNLLDQIYDDELDEEDLKCISMMKDEDKRTVDEVIRDYNKKKDAEAEAFKRRYLGLPNK